MGLSQCMAYHLPPSWREMVGLFRVIKIYVTEGGTERRPTQSYGQNSGYRLSHKATADSGIECPLNSINRTFTESW